MEPVKEPTEEQRNDPSLRAEIAFYDALTAVNLDGSVYYDVRVGRQVDAFAWVRDRWRGAAEVKGGQHMVKDGNWYRRETNGNFTKLDTSPPDQAFAAALAVRDTLKRRLNGHKTWINVILALPNMPSEDPAIKEYAKDRNVNVIWGLENLQAQLLGIISAQTDWYPPDELDILAESAALDRKAPPEQWLNRKAAQDDAAASSQSHRLPAQSGGPASGPGVDPGVNAAVSPTYSFEIHNHGTLNIYLSDSQLSAFGSDQSGSASVAVESPAANIPSSSAGAVDDGVEIDAPPDLGPDPIEGRRVGDLPDDYDPFSYNAEAGDASRAASPIASAKESSTS